MVPSTAITNNSIKHKFFVCTQLNDQTVLFRTISASLLPETHVNEALLAITVCINGFWRLVFLEMGCSRSLVTRVFCHSWEEKKADVFTVGEGALRCWACSAWHRQWVSYWCWGSGRRQKVVGVWPAAWFWYHQEARRSIHDQGWDGEFSTTWQTCVCCHYYRQTWLPCRIWPEQKDLGCVVEMVREPNATWAGK